MPKHDGRYDELDSRILNVVRIGLRVTDLQIANAAGVSRRLIKNRRRYLKLKRLTPVHKYPFATQRERTLAAVKKHRAGNPDIDRRAQANQRLKYKLLILKHFGAFCHHPEASSDQCSLQLELHHVNHDGKMHRLALGDQRECNTLTMYRFVAKMLSEGPLQDRFGKIWKEEDFTVLCRSHNAKLQ